MAHPHSLHPGVQIVKRSRQWRARELSCLLSFFVREFVCCALLPERLEKTGYLAILDYLPDTLDRVLRVLVKRETSAVEARARDSHAGRLGPKRNQYGGKSDCATRL